MSTSQKEHGGSWDVEMEAPYTGSHRDEQRRHRRNNSDSEEVQGVWNQEPRIQKFKEDSSQWDGEAAV